MTILRVFNSILLLLFLSFGAFAQKASLDKTDTQASIKASYLFQISRYTDWPDATKQGSFTIAVVGNPSLYSILVNKYANKPIGSQLLKIIYAETAAELKEEVQIIYIAPNIPIGSLVKNSKKKPVLIITEKIGALEQGAHVNFQKIEGIIRFELNDTRSQSNGILFNDKLKGWATKLK